MAAEPAVPAPRLSVTEKIGYSLGDLAANLVFQTLVTFLAFFYTNVLEIPASAASAIIFAAGMLGAFVFTPAVGLVADRTHTRWGKFRPWLLWTAVPFGLASMLTFTTPHLGERARVVYALATYTLLVLVYVANNLPYAALSGVLTGRMEERNSLSSYRFAAVMVAQFVIQVLLLPLVLLVGHGDKATGFRVVMTAFAAIGTVFFLIAFFTTRERVAPVRQRTTSIRQDLLDLVRSRPWLIMLAVTTLVFVNLALKGGMYIYYFKYYLSVPALETFIGRFGFEHVLAALGRLFGAGQGSGAGGTQDTAVTVFGVFNALGIIFMIVGIGCSKPLADRFGKRNVFGAALFVSTLFLLAFYFYPPRAVGLVVGSYTLHGFFYGITIPLLWSMVADVADYAEWKNDRRATALTFSAMLCGLKVGLSVGGALVAGVLAFYGYRAGAAAQPTAVVDGIRLTVSVFCSIPFLAAVALLFLYEINKPMESRIERELHARRRLAGVGSG